VKAQSEFRATVDRMAQDIQQGGKKGITRAGNLSRVLETFPKQRRTQCLKNYRNSSHLCLSS
jgi:hypothetical protein